MITWWQRWQSRRLRSQVTLLRNRVTTLEGDLQAERAIRTREHVTVKGALSWLGAHEREHSTVLRDHHAWIGALVEGMRDNPRRHRALRVAYESRKAALQPPPATPAPDPPDPHLPPLPFPTMAKSFEGAAADHPAPTAPEEA